MNKADLNRTVQLLEQQVKTLKDANSELLRTNCAECNRKRRARLEEAMKPFNDFQEALSGVMYKYGGSRY